MPRRRKLLRSPLPKPISWCAVYEYLGTEPTQTCANAGLKDSRQYLPIAWVTSATIVMKTRMKQYWKMPNQMICRNSSASRSLEFSLRETLTLNQVSPLLGVLVHPLSPPQHFLNHVSGQIHGLGCSPLKKSFCAWRSGAIYEQSSAKKLAIANAS